MEPWLAWHLFARTWAERAPASGPREASPTVRAPPFAPSLGAMRLLLLLGLAGCAFTVTGLEDPPPPAPTTSGSVQATAASPPGPDAPGPDAPDLCTWPDGGADLASTHDLSPAPSCTDGVTDGEETDVDCGGPDCPKCAVGRACQTGTDCVTLLCLFARCAL
jgi:hypothetical protein